VLWAPEKIVRVVWSPPQSRETIPAPKELARFERSDPMPEFETQPLHTGVVKFTSGASLYAESFMKNLRTHYPKSHRTATTTKPIDQLLQQLKDFYRVELAPNTVKNYARVMAEFERFLEATNLVPTNFAAALFIVDLFYDDERRKTLTLSGVYQYAKDLSAACGQTRCETWAEEGTVYLSKVTKILYNMGGAIPHKHAKPMIKEHAYSALVIVGWSEEERMVVFAMWKLAARAVDILTLNIMDCRKEFEGGIMLIVFEWIPKEDETGAGSGRSKNSNGRVLTCVVNAGEQTQRLWDYLEKRKKKKKQTFTDMTEEQIIKVLQRLDPEYTCHSPKRGALNHLGRQKVGYELIGRMARHNQPGRDLPRVTELYLEPEIYGLMGRTQDATKLL